MDLLMDWLWSEKRRGLEDESLLFFLNINLFILIGG